MPKGQYIHTSRLMMWEEGGSSVLYLVLRRVSAATRCTVKDRREPPWHKCQLAMLSSNEILGESSSYTKASNGLRAFLKSFCRV